MSYPQDDPLSRLYTFPANSQFWAELVKQSKQHPGAMRAPHFHVDCPDREQGLLVNKYFLRSFVAGWEQNNSHTVVKVDANRKDTTHHMSSEFWDSKQPHDDAHSEQQWDSYDNSATWQQQQQYPPPEYQSPVPGAVPDTSFRAGSFSPPTQTVSFSPAQRSLPPTSPMQQTYVSVQSPHPAQTPPRNVTQSHQMSGGQCPTCKQNVPPNMQTSVQVSPYASQGQRGVPHTHTMDTTQGGYGSPGVTRSPVQIGVNGGSGGGGGGYTQQMQMQQPMTSRSAGQMDPSMSMDSMNGSKRADRSMGGPSGLTLQQKLQNAQKIQRDYQGAKKDWTGQSYSPENIDKPRQVQYGSTIAHDLAAGQR